MTRCLAVDTSGIEYAIALVDGRELPGGQVWPRGVGAGDPPLLARIQALLDGQPWGLRELEAVVVARGPGSFTGLRVGLAVAVGIAYGRGIALYTVDSLPVLAARSQGPRPAAAMRDAGRGEAYAWRPGSPVTRLPVDALCGWLGDEPVVVEPEGALRTWCEALRWREVPAAQRRPLNEALAACAIEILGREKPVRYDELQALYTQPAAAAEGKATQP